MQYLKILFLVTTITLSGYSVFSQNVSAPKYSNEFLNIGVGARGLAMGRSQVASVSDVTSGYWNPAGMNDITSKYDIAYMHNEYFGGIAKYDYAAAAARIDSQSVLGISYIRFGIDNIPDTRFLFDANGQLDYNRIKYFSATDNAFLLTYASKIKKIPGLKVGANFKVIYRNIGSFANAWGFGLDAGAKYQYKKWMFGAVARDITSTFNVWTINGGELEAAYLRAASIDSSAQNTVPSNSIELTIPRVILGIGRYFNITKNQKVGLLASVDLDLTFDGKRNVLVKSQAVSLDPKIGLELNYQKIVFLRAGAGTFQQLKNFDNSQYWTWDPNFGVGVRIKSVTIDYSLTNMNNLSDGLYSNVFSVRINLN